MKEARPRIDSVDIVRGVIMIIMALDHTRDYFGMRGGSPTNLATTTTALFFTRWITNFCAPVFFLLTGTGAYLSLKRKTPAELSRFLFTRGVWLIFLEIVVLRCFAYQFNFDYHFTILIVIWALAWSMISLSVLVRFPMFVSVIFGAVLVLGHNLFDGVSWANPLWTILHRPGFLSDTPGNGWFVSYPLIPWLGVTALGYALGTLYNLETARRRAILYRLGAALTVAFVALRAANIYGDPVRFSTQKNAVFTALSFINTTKYPPSLLFLLMTLGPALVFLGLMDREPPKWMRPALTIGKVPLFYFGVHFMLIHALAVVVCYAQNGAVHWMLESPDLPNYPFTPPPNWGFALPVVYGVWASVVIMMYPLCRWFAALKQRRSDWWLSYL